ncbi:ATP-binding protein [Microbacterium sp. SSW1-49]|uniref:ATP-binding protein n=1 Tax=Microbacterium croceum TaxID=2851645 RepID=A0ABT0FGW7_9MICO|nr:ATP-binding protein [Microbacterium croceum]MCK2037293.1 ATP-binding protein [Microbacterium croceum]
MGNRLSQQRASEPRTDRQVGWLIALGSMVGAWAQAAPLFFAQAELFDTWWQVASWTCIALFVVLAVGGRVLPMTVLRTLWAVIPAAVITLQLASFFAYNGPAEGVVPWLWMMEPGSVTLLVLLFRPLVAVVLTVFSGLSVALSAWVFTGAVPEVIAAATPIHVSNIGFVVIFIGIRARLTQLRRLEEEARVAAERQARQEAEAERNAELQRLVHDEVLSVLAAAALFKGDVPRELQDEAAHALLVLRDSGDPDESESGATISAGEAAEEIRLRAARFSSVELSITDHGGSLPRRVVQDVSAAAAEAIRNARRHSGAERVVVDAVISPGRIRVVVRDHGVGFRVEAVPPERLGVRDSIIRRIEQSGGRAEIRSAPDAGVEVTLSWPR